MKRLFVSASLLLALYASTAVAQKAPPPPAKEKDQSIIIRKKGDKNEKTTIVIDGDKVTINGKPAGDYKDKDLEVLLNSTSDFTEFLPPDPPIAPLPPRGGAKTFEFHSFDSRSNSAFLGVASSGDDNGATVNTITKNSPAEKAGLKEGDVITKVGTTNIEEADDLVEAIGKYKPEDKVAITYKRDGKETTITVTLDKNKEQNFVWNNNRNLIRNFDFAVMAGKPRMGMRIQDLENNTGVKVIDINDDKDSPAFKAGLKEDDVITQINGKNVTSVKEAKDQLSDTKPGDDVKITYQRGGVSQTATVHLPKPLQTSDL